MAPSCMRAKQRTRRQRSRTLTFVKYVPFDANDSRWSGHHCHRNAVRFAESVSISNMPQDTRITIGLGQLPFHDANHHHRGQLHKHVRKRRRDDRRRTNRTHRVVALPQSHPGLCGTLVGPGKDTHSTPVPLRREAVGGPRHASHDTTITTRPRFTASRLGDQHVCGARLLRQSLGTITVHESTTDSGRTQPKKWQQHIIKDSQIHATRCERACPASRERS